jgi:predicted nucleotidyltransferase
MEWYQKFNEHDISIVRALNEKQVAFLIVGGTAVAFHGCRETHAIDDLDMLIDPTIENAKKFVGAVTEAARNSGLPLSKVIDPLDLIKPKVQFPFKFGAFYSEFLTPNSHEEFDHLMSRSHLTKIGIQKVNVVSLPDIIAMKVEAVRDSQNSFEKHSNDLERLRGKLANS